MRTTLRDGDGDGAGEIIGALVDLVDRRRRVLADIERDEAILVRRARAAGFSWQQVAAALDISKQAVHKKHGRR